MIHEARMADAAAKLGLDLHPLSGRVAA